MTTFGDCPACLLGHKVLRSDSNSITIHSVFQYLQFIRRENTRYIATIRHPTDRALSQYFYMFQLVSGSLNICCENWDWVWQFQPPSEENLNDHVSQNTSHKHNWICMVIMDFKERCQVSIRANWIWIRVNLKIGVACSCENIKTNIYQSWPHFKSFRYCFLFLVHIYIIQPWPWIKWSRLLLYSSSEICTHTTSIMTKISTKFNQTIWQRMDEFTD